MQLPDPYGHPPFKTAEIRSRPTKHRGYVLVVASRGVDFDAARTWATFAANVPVTNLGMAIGVISICDCVRFTQELEWRARIKRYDRADLWAWLTDPTSARRIEPFPVKGSLGLFDVADSLVNQAWEPVI